MGIQIHSHAVHKTVVATIQAGAIGKVKEVHSWSGKHWGDRNPRPDREGPGARRAQLGRLARRGGRDGRSSRGYYHPGEWRKRLDFGTGTFGDMGCHILDPVFAALALTAPTSVRSDGGGAERGQLGPGRAGAATSSPARPHDGRDAGSALVRRRPAAAGGGPGADRRAEAVSDQGSIYIGTEGVLYSPYIAAPVLLPAEKFADYKRPEAGRATTTTSSSSRRAAATARPRRRSRTPAR